MDLKRFLNENNSLPENRRVCISPCFRDGDGAAEWELRAVTEEEYRRAAENAKDKWAALCVLAAVTPDLRDKGLWESYGTASAEDTLKEMLYPGEYLRLLEEVKALNGFAERRAAWKEQAKN